MVPLCFKCRSKKVFCFCIFSLLLAALPLLFELYQLLGRDFFVALRRVEEVRVERGEFYAAVFVGHVAVERLGLYGYWEVAAVPFVVFVLGLAAVVFHRDEVFFEAEGVDGLVAKVFAREVSAAASFAGIFKRGAEREAPEFFFDVDAPLREYYPHDFLVGARDFDGVRALYLVAGFVRRHVYFALAHLVAELFAEFGAEFERVGARRRERERREGEDKGRGFADFSHFRFISPGRGRVRCFCAAA